VSGELFVAAVATGHLVAVVLLEVGPLADWVRERRTDRFAR
jgi:hypothetical protein